MTILETKLSRYSWLSFSQMSDILSDNPMPSVLVRARGIHVWDGKGKQYIDGLSGAFCVNVGYGRKRIIDAAHRAATKIHFASPFTAGNPWGIRLAEKLAYLAKPTVGPDAKVFFVNSGSEAVETAIKLARAYSHRTGYSNRHRILCRSESYHGTTMGALSASGFSSMREDFTPLVPGFQHGPHTLCKRCALGLDQVTCNLQCAKDLLAPLFTDANHNVAGVLLEPFQNCGGNIPPPKGYLPFIADSCRRLGVPLILDEVICGFGRLGYWFGAQCYGIEADILACAKGLTSGYDSLGAVIVRRDIAEVFDGDECNMFHHGSTFGGRPSATAAALENIAIIEEECLLEACQARGIDLRKLIEKQLIGLKNVGQVRSEGLLFGIDIVSASNHKLLEEGHIADLHRTILQSGLICCMRCSMKVPVLEIAPPFIISQDDASQIVSIISSAFISTFGR